VPALPSCSVTTLPPRGQCQHVRSHDGSGQATDVMAHLSNIAVLGNDITAWNSAVDKTVKPTVLLTTIGLELRETGGVLLAIDCAGQTIFLEFECSLIVKDEKALCIYLVHVIKSKKRRRNVLSLIKEELHNRLEQIAVHALRAKGLGCRRLDVCCIPSSWDLSGAVG